MNSFKNILQLTILCVGVIWLFQSCKKKYDNPPVNTIPVGGILTIAEIKALPYPHKFVGDSSVYAVVTMDESTGNLYKNIFVQDATGAINVRLFSSGSINEGDSIRIYLKNTVVGQYTGMVQLDSVDTDDNITKLANNRHLTPQTVRIDQIEQSLQSKLISIDSVEFVSSSAGQTWADGQNQVSLDRTITNCQETDEIIIRSSGYSNFADDLTPSGNGQLTAVVTQFNTTMQLLIRTPDEVLFNNPRCGAIYVFSKDFNDGSITSGGWTSYWNGTAVGGTNVGEWEIYGGDVASASNYEGGANYSTTSWLISPPIDLNTIAPGTPVLSFDNVTQYSGQALELWVSTDYDGFSDPDVQGTWTNLTSIVPNWDVDSGDWDFVSSGGIDLSAYKSGSTFIAFKYQGSTSNGATWELDNINIENQ